MRVLGIVLGAIPFAILAVIGAVHFGPLGAVLAPLAAALGAVITCGIIAAARLFA